METICFVTAHVLGTSFKCARLACSDTLTTSKGFTRIASVTPAPKPASENVCKKIRLSTQDDICCTHKLKECCKNTNEDIPVVLE